VYLFSAGVVRHRKNNYCIVCMQWKISATRQGLRRAGRGETSQRLGKIGKSGASIVKNQARRQRKIPKYQLKGNDGNGLNGRLFLFSGLSDVEE
jgi:hypothetical protein